MRTMAKGRRALAKPAARAASRSAELDDTALRSLSKDEVRKLSIDAWEPSLLRHMLAAHDKLRKSTGGVRAEGAGSTRRRDERPRRAKPHRNDR